MIWLKAKVDQVQVEADNTKSPKARRCAILARAN